MKHCEGQKENSFTNGQAKSEREHLHMRQTMHEIIIDQKGIENAKGSGWAGFEPSPTLHPPPLKSPIR